MTDDTPRTDTDDAVEERDAQPRRERRETGKRMQDPNQTDGGTVEPQAAPQDDQPQADPQPAQPTQTDLDQQSQGQPQQSPQQSPQQQQSAGEMVASNRPDAIEDPPGQGQQQRRSQGQGPFGTDDAQPGNSAPDPGPQDNVQLDPWEIHQNVLNSMNKSEGVVIETEWGSLNYRMNMPPKGAYQAAVASLPDELVEWMADIAEEYGNDADLEEVVQDEDVDVPRIVYGEKVVDAFERLLAESLEHTPKSGQNQDKLTDGPTRDIIDGMDVNTQTVPLGFQAIRLGSNRSGVKNFRMVE